MVIQEKVKDSDYVSRHKSDVAAFTRVRKLSFIVMFVLILRSSVKSLQLILNEFTLETGQDFTVTAGAFTKARKKLKHTAYIELNDDILDIYYREDDIKRFKGYRLLAFDGSRITLPKSKEIKNEFGSIPIGNETAHDLGDYSRASYQACYDVLNHMAVKSLLGHGTSYEVDQALAMIPELNADDLLIYDRGYASYYFMSALIKHHKDFIIRFSKSSFKEVNKMFESDAPRSKIVTLKMPLSQKKKVKENGFPQALKIKLVRVELSTGEIEVLATSLLDETTFSHEDFSYLYSLRWGVETFYAKIKGRLALENFTGKTVESIYQDFWSTIFISNLETIMTEDIEEEMNANKPEENKMRKVNKAVSFNAIKNMAFEIFFNESNKAVVLSKLTKLFAMNPVVVRENREVIRKKTSPTRSLNFQKRMRKHVF